MIDIENEIFTRVHDELIAQFPTLTMDSKPAYNPSKFPFVILYEYDNQTYRNAEDSGSRENAVRVTYIAEVYSNRHGMSKSECKDIMSVLDNYMISLGFMRTLLTPLNMQDTTIYRLHAEYRAVVDKNKVIYT